MVYKIVYKVGRGHTHFRVWAGERTGSLGLCGELIMLNAEFSNFRKMLEAGAGLMDTVVFEEQIISSHATRENNGFHPA